MKKIVIGSRSSPLAQLQLNSACALFQKDFLTQLYTETRLFTTPGDRDKQTHLHLANDDFFTADLDHALLNGEIDCAVHSAKDLPQKLDNKIDFFCLPSREDPRDCLVGKENTLSCRIGVSSERRIQWAKKAFPHAELHPIRGTIEERIAQLDAGKFDLIIMAVAALNRLNLQHRILKIIAKEALPPPESQGFLALTFRKNDSFFQKLRLFYTYPVQLVGAGPGAEGYLTLAAQKALSTCEICLYDALGSDEVLKYVSPIAQKIYVGKRLGEQGLKQDEIGDKILYYARLGLKVVRLKGGDPGIFGRLAEEVELLESYKIDYNVIAGISSLFAATTATGLLLTRRGTSKGFSVVTPREAQSGDAKVVEESQKTSVAFMATHVAEHFLNTFSDSSLPACAIFNASLSSQQIISGSVATLASKIEQFLNQHQRQLPGLLLVGKACAPQYLYCRAGLLTGKKIIVTCTQTLSERPIAAITRFGGTAIALPMIELIEKPFNYQEITKYDYLIITSPTLAKITLEGCLKQGVDLRKLPKIVTCGSGTTQTFKEYGILVDFQPESLYGNQGLISIAQDNLKSTDRVLRLQSDLASKTTEETLKKICQYTSIVLAENRPILQKEIPSCDAIFFASSSAVKAFSEAFGQQLPENIELLAIGEPTKNELKKHYKESPIFTPDVATSFECIAQYAKMTCIFN